MPPRSFASAAAILSPIAVAWPMNAPGPVRIVTSPIFTSASVTPGSCASAMPDQINATAAASAPVLQCFPAMVIPPCGVSLRQRPVGPVLLDVAPEPHQAVRLEAQEEHDHHAVGERADLVHVLRERLLVAAEQPE